MLGRRWLWVLLLVLPVGAGIGIFYTSDARRTRRIEINESAAILACKNYAEAQDRYRRTDFDADGVLEYAQTARGRLGLCDEKSALIPIEFAAAFCEPEPEQSFSGYYFRILTGQGSEAPGGEKSYVVNGNMTLGYALVAYPMEYGRSGRAIFLMNNTGTVYRKDLGLDTAKLVPQINVYGGQIKPKDAIAEAPLLRIGNADDELKSTHVTSYIQREHRPDLSLLWCATFQLSWDEFRKLLGEAPRLSGNPTMALRLNERSFPREGLDIGSYFAAVGVGFQGVDRIRKDFEARFPKAASDFQFPELESDEDIVCIAYLFKNLSFPKPFVRATSPLKFQETNVLSFGIWKDVADWSAIAKQVVIWNYRSDSEFVIELQTKESDDRLLLAKIPSKGTLEETVKDVLGRIDGQKALALHEDERFEAPIFNFDLTWTFGEIFGAELLNTPHLDIVADAKQNIRFSLDERGAVLRSIAMTWVLANGDEPPKPRQLVFDRPFLILMIRKGAEVPYFAFWVANAELMAKK